MSEHTWAVIQKISNHLYTRYVVGHFCILLLNVLYLLRFAKFLNNFLSSTTLFSQQMIWDTKKENNLLLFVKICLFATNLFQSWRYREDEVSPECLTRRVEQKPRQRPRELAYFLNQTTSRWIYHTSRKRKNAKYVRIYDWLSVIIIVWIPDLISSVSSDISLLSSWDGQRLLRGWKTTKGDMVQ